MYLNQIAGRNINNFRYADYTTLTVESEEELESLQWRVKEESEKAGLKLNIQKTKIMASDSITSWQIEGEKVEAVPQKTHHSKMTKVAKYSTILANTSDRHT